MANYENLKFAIQQVVKTNGNNAITGALLQQSLFAMINSLGAGYQFFGVATPTTNPGTPDKKVFYIASEPGTYTSFDGIVVTEDEVVVLTWDSSWHKASIGSTKGDPGPQGERGPQGPKGDKMTYADLTESDKADLYEGGASLIRPLLDGKQDTISDLDAIREGAENGSTALQSESDPIYTADKPNLALKSELATKQDTITDLGTIRSGAAKGATALQSESDPVYLADKPSLALKTEIPDVSGKADKATTLAGYGIGDAYTKSEVEAAIASAITTTLNTEV